MAGLIELDGILKVDGLFQCGLSLLCPFDRETIATDMYCRDVPGKPDANQVDQARCFAANATADKLMQPFGEVLTELKQKWGKWQQPWGESNRFKRDFADIDSKHFFDQGEMYTQGKFKDVLFYRKDVEKKAERTYDPGE